MNTLEIKEKNVKIKGCTHKDAYISAQNNFRQPLLVPNNCQSTALLHKCPLFQLSNIPTHK